MAALDLVFVIDCTGSMGSYISSATKNIETIVEEIVRSGKLASPEHLRIGLVAYRDHPPQELSYVTMVHELSSDVAGAKRFLTDLWATGGGDGPEASTSALQAALGLQWNEAATKIAVLITDAPPHSIGEPGDGFPDTEPGGIDPLHIVREMAARSIGLYMVACEPALSSYQRATEFYKALTIISSTLMVPLTNANLLAHVIVGTALEQMDLDQIVSQVGSSVGHLIHSGEASVDDIALQLHRSLQLQNHEVKRLVFDDIYEDIPEAHHNIAVWANAPSVRDARGAILPIRASRFNDAYNKARYDSSIYRSRPVPPRPAATRIDMSDAHGRGRADADDDLLDSLPDVSDAPAPRRSTRSTTFAAFSAPTAMGVSDVPLGANPSTLMQSQDDVLTDAIELKMQGVSLEQARRVAIAAAWRNAAPRK